MKAVKFIVIGAAGVAALGVAAPAAAQYPGYGYGYPGYGNNTGANVIGQVLQQILNPYGQFGYNRGVNPQIAVNQCSAAVQQRLQGGAYAGYGGQYGGGYGQYGYNQYGYNQNAYSNARVLGVTRVEQRSSSTLRVRGVATSGMSYGYGNQYGGYGGYGGQYGGGYGAYGAQAPADLTFRCDIDYRGYIRDIDIDRRG